METSKQIARKAYELYKTYGVHSVTMDDIANSLAMSKKTIYVHFGSKDALVETVITQQIEENRSLLVWQQDTLKTVISSLIADLKNVFNFFRKLNPGILFGLKKYHPDAFNILTEYINGFVYKVIENDIQLGIKQGLFRENVDLYIIIHFLLKNLQSIFIPDTRLQVVRSERQQELQLLNHFLYGIMTPKAHNRADGHSFNLIEFKPGQPCPEQL